MLKEEGTELLGGSQSPAAEAADVHTGHCHMVRVLAVCPRAASLPFLIPSLLISRMNLGHTPLVPILFYKLMKFRSFHEALV